MKDRIVNGNIIKTAMILAWPVMVSNLFETVYNLTDAFSALQLREALDEFESGRVAVLVCSTPYSCPGAPCETAFLADSISVNTRNRQSVEIAIYTPEPDPRHTHL